MGKIITSRGGVCCTILLPLTLSSTGIVRDNINIIKLWGKTTVITPVLHNNNNNNNNKNFKFKQMTVLHSHTDQAEDHLPHHLLPAGTQYQCPPDGGGMISCILRTTWRKKEIAWVLVKQIFGH